MLDAIVIAGGPNTGLLRGVSSEDYEAMIRIGNKPMIKYVVDALLESGVVDRVAVSGPEKIKEVLPGDPVKLAPVRGSVIGNIMSAMALIDQSKPVLISTCDIPLLTGEAIRDFVSLCGDIDADFYYPIVSMEDACRSLPGVTRTAVKLREGTFTGGNLFIVNPGVLPNCAPKAQAFVDYRKSPLKLSRLLGMRFVIKLLLNRLSIPEVEKKISELMGIKAKAVITAFPGIGIDVDKPSDYEIISKFLGHQ